MTVTRVRDAAGWVRWHQAELSAVTLPGVAAVTVSPWWAAVTAVAAVWWWRRERDAPDRGGHDDRDAQRDSERDERCDAGRGTA